MTKISVQINTKKWFWGVAATLVLLLVSGADGAAVLNPRESPVVLAVKSVSPAVVNISSQYEIRKNINPFFGYGRDSLFDQFFRDFFSPEMERRERRTSLGSGVIIDGDRGLVLTNSHVVDRAVTITVTLNDNRDFEAAVVGMDPDSDLAVLKIQTHQKLPAIQMGNSDDIMIGESVIAIGNPFGFSHTVTTGVVSAVNRGIKTPKRVFNAFIQTDASINPGNSGGPLLNINGELIGINTAIYAEAQGIGFAIPINRAKRIISDLINYGEVLQVWIGLTVQPIDGDLAAYLQIPTVAGVLVQSIEPQSPAEKAGVLEGDIILSLNGAPLSGIHAYQLKKSDISVGQTIVLEIIRSGKRTQLPLTTEFFPPDRALTMAEQRLGIVVSALDDQNRAKFGLQARMGVVITQVHQGSHLHQIGVNVGDIIRQIDEERVDTLTDFKTALIKYRNKPSLVLLIQRNGHLYYINATMKDYRS